MTWLALIGIGGWLGGGETAGGAGAARRRGLVFGAHGSAAPAPAPLPPRPASLLFPCECRQSGCAAIDCTKNRERPAGRGVLRTRYGDAAGRRDHRSSNTKGSIANENQIRPPHHRGRERSFSGARSRVRALGPPARSRSRVPGSSCDVVVTVTGTPPGPVVITASDVKMEKRKRGVMITWKLADNSAFEFRAGSIKAHVGRTGQRQADDDAGRRGTRSASSRTPTARQYKVRNKNDVAATLSYDITVYHKATGAPYTLDPVIFNDP